MKIKNFIILLVFLLYVVELFSQNHFTVTPTAACGNASVNFTNLNPSQNYQPVFMLTTGFKYNWDFGNGQTSTLENPGPINYSQPGIYDVNYILTIDTVGFFLTKVDVTAIGASDPFGGAPDPYIIIRDGSYNVVYTTQSNPYSNQNPPYEWNFNLKLDNPPYFIWVWDSDSMDADDNCVDGTENTPGTSTQIVLPANNANGFGTTIYTGTNGGLEYKFTFYKPVITYTETQQIQIFEKPDAPILSNNIINICLGEQVPEISAVGSPGNTIKWYSDENLQNLVHTGNNISPDLSGEGTFSYYATQTNTNNCESTPSNVTINITKIPSPVLNPYNNTYCLGQIIPEFSAIGNNLKWYHDANLQNWICDGNILNIQHNQEGEYSYYVVQTNEAGTCVSDPVNLSFSIIDAISAEVVTSNAKCYQSNDGTAAVVNLNGNSPFSFLRSNGAETENTSGFGAGDHSVIIRDANYCIKILDFVISEPNELVVETNAVTGFCPYDDFIRINTSVSGGTPPYNFLWSDGSTSSDLQNVPHGTYNLTITDENNCQVTKTETLYKPDNFNVVASITKSSCPLNSDGSISVEVTGGTQPYSYAWTSGANSEIAENLSSGTYSLTITDFYDCEYTKEFNLTDNYSICLVPATVFTPNGDGKK
ncbi:MAG TPA: SprB repeat-containing protein [Bacteroidales bacterium]|nr:SprB repeat-containing protein [Bacteroidales bacterium]HOL98161.1 SprB repeat-containing protein [Bacteroidales bacterium]HOM36519.1 SprB repeat-containing protein [Bacteroidales bacterium]HPD23941.1 SprB repeat-containing protein [Bacteroidales bacterium]HRS99921.1 SprB repeat-containing protein [Bacteroidales bacterium]